jgi:hypothetical protein
MAFHLFSTSTLDLQSHIWLTPAKAAPCASPQVRGGASSYHIHNMKMITHARVPYVIACSYQSALHLLAIVNKRLVRLHANWQPFDENDCSSLYII